MERDESCHYGHDHGAEAGAVHQHRAAASAKLWKALGLTGFFMVVELIGGFWSQSLALISDAVHMLTDAGGLTLSIFAIWLAGEALKRKNPRWTFGLQRAEILGALLSGILIWVLAAGLVIEAIDRVRNPVPIQGWTVFGIALLGLTVNLIVMRVLKHDHDHLNLRAAYLHVLSDLLGSVAAAISGLVIATTGWTSIDPIVTFLTAILITFSAWGLIKEAVTVLMEGAPSEIDREEVERLLRGISGVHGLHDLHIWSLTSGVPALSVHLLAEDAVRCTREAQLALRAKYPHLHATIQVEPPGASWTEDGCGGCTHPHHG